MTEPSMTVRFGAATHQGLVRNSNEDSYLTVPPVFLVADGMGGHSRGEVASRAVTEAFAELSHQRWLTSDDLVSTVDRAARLVMDLPSPGRAPGSTLSGVGMSKQGGAPCWLVFNIGDSRTQLLRDGQLTQISVDHSAAARVPEAKGAVSRHVITRALGAGLAPPTADQWLIPARNGDRMLVCSDGLSNDVSAELITATLLSVADPRQAAQALIQAALNAGGHDNVTAVVIDCEEATSVAAIGLDDPTESLEGDDTVPDLPGGI